MKPSMALLALLLAPIASTQAESVERCPSPEEITFSDVRYVAPARKEDATWQGVALKGSHGHVRGFKQATFNPYHGEEDDTIVGTMTGCEYRLDSGSVRLAYHEKHPGAPAFLIPPHEWLRHPDGRGHSTYVCTGRKAGARDCSFTAL